MGAVLTSTQVTCRQVDDFVHLTASGALIRIPYRIAIEVANGIRLAAKMAAQFDRAPHTIHRELAETDEVQELAEELPTVERPRQARQSGQRPNFSRWDVAFEGALVVVSFGRLQLRLGYEDALRLSPLLRQHARHAKRWAGDISRNMVLRAHLGTAEEHGRMGL